MYTRQIEGTCRVSAKQGDARLRVHLVGAHPILQHFLDRIPFSRIFPYRNDRGHPDRAHPSSRNGTIRCGALPILPEERLSKAPTTARLLEIFSGLSWYEFEYGGEIVTFPI